MLGDACLQGNSEHTHTQGWGRGKSHPFSIRTLQADLTDKGTVALHSSGRDFMLEGSRMI